MSEKELAAFATGKALLEGLGSAVGVFYNYSNALPCFNYTAGPNKETEEDGNLWGFQYCSEHFMPMSRDGGASPPPVF